MYLYFYLIFILQYNLLNMKDIPLIMKYRTITMLNSQLVTIPVKAGLRGNVAVSMERRRRNVNVYFPTSLLLYLHSYDLS